MITCAIIISVELIATGIDYASRSTEDRGPKTESFVRFFSLLHSWKIFRNTGPKKNAIRTFEGIRALSMTWVVMGHSMFIPFEFNAISNLLDVLRKWPMKLPAQTLLNAFFSVDSFFFISGALLSYLFVKRQGKIQDLPMMLLCRFVRLTVC